MRILAKNLFKTFILSTVLAIAANCGYYIIVERGQTYDYKNAVSLIAGKTLILTVILLIMSLQVLFLANKIYRDSLWVRLFLYFSGPLAFLIAVFTIPMKPADKLFDLITGIIFAIVHYVFYRRTITNITA